jgi:hypothetical protein
MEKNNVGCFSRGRPSSAPTPAYSRAWSQPVTIPLTAKTRRPRPACQLPTPTTGVIPAKPRHEHPAKAASCRPVPSSHYWLMIVGRTVTSPLLHHHRSAAPLCRRYTVEMPAPGARQRGLVQPTLLTELALPKGCRLGPSVALPACARGHLGVVRWCTFSCHVDTAPPTLSSVARTTMYG